MVIATYYYLKKNEQTWKKEAITGPLSQQILYQMSSKENCQLKQLAEILNKLLILHAEHEQNCSTFTVRTVASSGGDVYSSVAAGIAAFKGKLHGGASQSVSEMYQELLEYQLEVKDYIKDKVRKKQRIMGLGHRIYRCWDPRAKIMFDMLSSECINRSAAVCYKRLATSIIKHISEDEFFVKREIYPNPDLFNCIFYKLIGVPSSMNTVMLSISRIAGWLAHYHESIKENSPLIRPRQLPRKKQMD